ncbi:MAG: hypothetical protein KatS3mg105_1747 [Gemmatales bacterium]|nr:MAG: hypothetical protein KatS3mg105_1747 [Gemmatales bacterium]
MKAIYPICLIALAWTSGCVEVPLLKKEASSPAERPKPASHAAVRPVSPKDISEDNAWRYVEQLEQELEQESRSLSDK